MFIESEATPNPDTLKFLPGRLVLAEGTVDFANKEQAIGKSPLAEALFSIDGVSGVFFGYDFISVSKGGEGDWQLLKPAILGVLMEHFMAGLPIMSDSANDANQHGGGEGREGGEGSAKNYDEADSKIVEQICELLDTRVRPAVAQDGGDIVFHGYDKGIVYLSMRGACAGCPSSTATLKMGIENLLRHYVPEVVEVRPFME